MGVNVTPTAVWSPYCSMNELLSEVNIQGTSWWWCSHLKYLIVVKKGSSDINDWDLICFPFRWSCENPLNSLAAIRCDQWLQPYQLHHIKFRKRVCSDCLNWQLTVVHVVFLSKLRAEVAKYSACLHVWGKQSFKASASHVVIWFWHMMKMTIKYGEVNISFSFIEILSMSQCGRQL